MKHTFKRYKFLFILFPVAILFAVSGIVMWLWNMLLPEIIGVKAVTFWQAMGILVLSKILFGGFHGKSCKHKRRFEEMKHHNRLAAMSDEEKEKLRAEWKKRCSGNFFRKNENL